MAVASLEVSTSSAKCILFSYEQGIITQATLRYSREVADGPTQDPEGVLECALDVLRQVVAVADATGIRTEALGLTGTWHSLLLLDVERRPIGRIRTWADMSGTPSVAPIRADAGFVKLFYHRTGCMVHSMYPVWKWQHIRNCESGAASRAVFLSSQIEYIFQSLTGCARVSRCIASGTGMLNINTLEWDEEILRMAGIRPEQLGELEDAWHTAPLLPSVAKRVGLPSGIPVTVGFADGAMNQVGIGGLRSGSMSMSVGTSGALRVVHAMPVIPTKPSTWCYYLFGGRRLAGAAINNGTNCVDWFLSGLGSEPLDLAIYEQYSDGAASVDPAQAPMFMPFLFGERCPGWREDRTGGFLDVRSSHGEFDLYYAILEGILFNMRQCYDSLVEVGGTPDRILLSGGILNSDLWMQMAADIFGRELLATGVANDSTVGGALMALEAVIGDGRIESYAPNIARRFEPHDDRQGVYERRYKRYLNLYGSLSGEH